MNLRPSINSVLGWANPLAGLARRIPWRVWLGAACLGAAAFWLHGHDTRMRQKIVAEEAGRQTAARVSTLRKQAAANVRAANVQNAKAVSRLESRRRELERQDRKLAARLASLRLREQEQARRVAALPTPEVVTRVAARLGLQRQDLAPANGGGRPARADAGNGRRPETAAKAGSHLAPAAGSSPKERAAAGTTPTAGHWEPAVLPLSASGARKVETALVELDACRSEGRVEGEMAQNCQARAAAEARTITRQADSIRKLNQALTAKDRILAAREAEYKTELRAVRGTFWSRVGRTTKHVAIGVALGVVAGMAIR